MDSPIFALPVEHIQPLDAPVRLRGGVHEGRELHERESVCVSETIARNRSVHTPHTHHVRVGRRDRILRAPRRVPLVLQVHEEEAVADVSAESSGVMRPMRAQNRTHALTVLCSSSTLTGAEWSWIAAMSAA